MTLLRCILNLLCYSHLTVSITKQFVCLLRFFLAGLSLTTLPRIHRISGLKFQILKPTFFGLKMIMKSGLEKIFLKLGSFHKLCLHLGVGRWSEKHVVYYIKSANQDHMWSKNANRICESSLTEIKIIWLQYGVFLLS